MSPARPLPRPNVHGSDFFLFFHGFLACFSILRCFHHSTSQKMRVSTICTPAPPRPNCKKKHGKNKKNKKFRPMSPARPLPRPCKTKKNKKLDPWTGSGERPGRGHGSELLFFFCFFHVFFAVWPGGRRCANCRNAHFLRGTMMKTS